MYKIFLQNFSDEESNSIQFLVASSDSYVEIHLKFESLCNFLRIHYCSLKILSAISIESSYSYKDNNFVIVSPTCSNRFVFKDGSSLVVSLENAE